MKVRIEFTEPLLGTLAANPEVATEFTLCKHPKGPQKDELMAQTPEDEVDKQATVFPRDKETKKPLLWDYQFRGFFKEALIALCQTGEYTKEAMKKAKLSGYGPTVKKAVDKFLFVNPRKIVLQPPTDEPFQFLERPLRAETMKGERICLARSEVCPAGAVVEIEVVWLIPAFEDFVKDALDYGALKGMGQWRNSGMGRFKYEIIE